MAALDENACKITYQKSSVSSDNNLKKKWEIERNTTCEMGLQINVTNVLTLDFHQPVLKSQNLTLEILYRCFKSIPYLFAPQTGKNTVIRI